MHACLACDFLNHACRRAGGRAGGLASLAASERHRDRMAVAVAEANSYSSVTQPYYTNLSSLNLATFALSLATASYNGIIDRPHHIKKINRQPTEIQIDLVNEYGTAHRRFV